MYMAWTSYEPFGQKKDSQDQRTHYNKNFEWNSSFQFKMEVPLATSTVETKVASTSKNDDSVHKIVARSSSSQKRPP